MLQRRIGHLLKRPVGRPAQEVRHVYASFHCQAQTWTRSRSVVARIEWHPGELYPRVGFLVTNLARPPERVVAFYNQRGTAEQWIKEGKNAAKWTRPSCRSMRNSPVRLQLHAMAYNMANFFHTLVLPDEVKCSSPMTSAPILTTFSRRVVAHARSTVFQMVGGAVSRDLFGRISGDDRRVAAKAGRAKLTLAGRITKGQLTGELRLPCG